MLSNVSRMCTVYRTLVVTFTKLGCLARSLPSVPLILDQSVGDMRKVKLSALRGCSVSCAPTLTVSKGRARSGAANPSRNDLRWAALSVRSSVPTRPQLHALHVCHAYNDLIKGAIRHYTHRHTHAHMSLMSRKVAAVLENILHAPQDQSWVDYNSWESRIDYLFYHFCHENESILYHKELIPN